MELDQCIDPHCPNRIKVAELQHEIGALKARLEELEENAARFAKKTYDKLRAAGVLDETSVRPTKRSRRL